MTLNRHFPKFDKTILDIELPKLATNQHSISPIRYNAKQIIVLSFQYIYNQYKDNGLNIDTLQLEQVTKSKFNWIIVISFKLYDCDNKIYNTNNRISLNPNYNRYYKQLSINPTTLKITMKDYEIS